MTFEHFIAARYLRARRKEAVISVITAISVIGVAAGVMALVISLAITNGFRSTLQRNLLGATAHVNILEKEPGPGISNWRELIPKLRLIPHVTAVAPVLYGQVYLSGPVSAQGAVLKGIAPEGELKVSDTLRRLKAGSLDHFTGNAIVLGSRLAQDTGMMLGSQVNVISPQGRLTPFGPRPSSESFRVVGIFETGFYDLDDKWSYVPMAAAQRILSLPDVVNSIELRVDDIYLAPEIGKQAEAIAGPKFAATNWQEQNRQLLKALNLEKVVTVITIGMIELIAALNILIVLVMMVMEKRRDIAVLMSMGARKAQIRRIFITQGMIIGLAGTAIGLALGYSLCYFANHYQWIPLDEQVYALSFVPFEPKAFDGLWIAAVALGVSFLATIYPARNATRISPAEVLRYE
ncbi:MAG: ABC transporter permease [Acidobacteriota bacterium]|nr:ABC transporter permease [Acidobacteriota bacterium]